MPHSPIRKSQVNWMDCKSQVTFRLDDTPKLKIHIYVEEQSHTLVTPKQRLLGFNRNVIHIYTTFSTIFITFNEFRRLLKSFVYLN